MAENIDLICIGEGLIELSANESLSDATCLDKYFGGDSMATAVAASRLGSNVGYITVLGNDYLKDFLIDAWQSEGLDVSQVRLTDASNGLYFIARCKNGKKEYVYYRKKAAAGMISEENISPEYIAASRIVYSTGITQSLSITAREAVLQAFKLAKENDIQVAYDLNFTERVWDAVEAKEAFEEVLPYVNTIFLNLEHDLKPLYGLESPEQAIKQFWDNGVNIVVVREQNGEITVGYGGDIYKIKQLEVEIIDTTGSGDVFNGAFLHGILQGNTPFEAAKLASIMATFQIQGIGAIKSIPSKAQVYEAFNKLEQA